MVGWHLMTNVPILIVHATKRITAYNQAIKGTAIKGQDRSDIQNPLKEEQTKDCESRKRKRLRKPKIVGQLQSILLIVLLRIIKTSKDKFISR